MTLVTLKEKFAKMNGGDRVLILIFVLGVVVILVSLFRGILVDRQVQVEYLAAGKSESTAKIFVDVEGAVINPGVYEIPFGSRVKDALVSAGGMSDSADRDYCEKNLNLAEVVKDGEKIYIPFEGVAPAVNGYSTADIQGKKVNVNTASEAELDTLWGVGESRVASIVKNRPYKNVEELVSKGALTKSIFEKNKPLLSVY